MQTTKLDPKFLAKNVGRDALRVPEMGDAYITVSRTFFGVGRNFWVKCSQIGGSDTLTAKVTPNGEITKILEFSCDRHSMGDDGSEKTQVFRAKDKDSFQLVAFRLTSLVSALQGTA